MGNLCTCFAQRPAKRQPSKRLTHPQAAGPNSTNRWGRIRSSRKDKLDDTLLQEQAIAAAILFSHQNGAASLPFDRSSSLRYPPLSSSSKKQGPLPRSSSTRPRSLTDPLLQPHQLINQYFSCENSVHISSSDCNTWLSDGRPVAITFSIDIIQNVKLEDLETNHFVLVHGGGFGAWCWYKSIALLEENGFRVTAVDLTGSGIHSSDSNAITSLSQYVKPLTDLVEKLADGEKVILVGHDFGGVCVSYTMELFPHKIAKAIFVAATMLTNGQNTLDIFSQQGVSNDLMRQAQVFLYANGKDKPPTAIDFNKSLLGDLLFNQSPAKDIALASVSMRPIPFSPVLEKISLCDKKHGSVRRFYIETLEDNAIPVALQESMVNSSPPEKVFQLKGADHSPFFSKPQALHKLLVEISRIPRT